MHSNSDNYSRKIIHMDLVDKNYKNKNGIFNGISKIEYRDNKIKVKISFKDLELKDFYNYDAYVVKKDDIIDHIKIGSIVKKNNKSSYAFTINEKENISYENIVGVVVKDKDKLIIKGYTDKNILKNSRYSQNLIKSSETVNKTLENKKTVDKIQKLSEVNRSKEKSIKLNSNTIQVENKSDDSIKYNGYKEIKSEVKINGEPYTSIVKDNKSTEIKNEKESKYGEKGNDTEYNNCNNIQKNKDTKYKESNSIDKNKHTKYDETKYIEKDKDIKYDKSNSIEKEKDIKYDESNSIEKDIKYDESNSIEKDKDTKHDEFNHIEKDKDTKYDEFKYIEKGNDLKNDESKYIDKSKDTKYDKSKYIDKSKDAKNDESKYIDKSKDTKYDEYKYINKNKNLKYDESKYIDKSKNTKHDELKYIDKSEYSKYHKPSYTERGKNGKYDKSEYIKNEKDTEYHESNDINEDKKTKYDEFKDIEKNKDIKYDKLIDFEKNKVKKDKEDILKNKKTFREKRNSKFSNDSMYYHIDQLYKEHQIVNPFGKQYLVDCIKLSILDLIFLPIFKTHIKKNPFIIHSYVIHKHFLFINNKDEGIYYIGIPDYQNQYYSEIGKLYGLKKFVRTTETSDVFGYWLIDIN